jgi:peroxiredoxin-like protein
VDLVFAATLALGGQGPAVGEVELGGVRVRYSAPASMGGPGEGASPEELLVAAVASCYSLTLLALLRRRNLPVRDLAVAARGIVSGFPQRPQVAAIEVAPRIAGGDAAQLARYRELAQQACERCLIGQAVRSQVAYRVGEVSVVP